MLNAVVIIYWGGGRRQWWITMETAPDQCCIYLFLSFHCNMFLFSSSTSHSSSISWFQNFTHDYLMTKKSEKRRSKNYLKERFLIICCSIRYIIIGYLPLFVIFYKIVTFSQCLVVYIHNLRHQNNFCLFWG